MESTVPSLCLHFTDFSSKLKYFNSTQKYKLWLIPPDEKQRKHWKEYMLVLK